MILTTKFTKKDVDGYGPYLAGWHTLQPYMMSLPLDSEGLQALQIMLSMEVKDKCRENIVKRLVGRIRTIRRLLEEQYLYSLMGDKYVQIQPRKKKHKKRTAKPNLKPPVKTTAEMLVGSGE